jgi:hypothetical protein
MGTDSALLLDEAKEMKRKIEKSDADNQVICDVLQNLMEREVAIKVCVCACVEGVKIFVFLLQFRLPVRKAFLIPKLFFHGAGHDG